MPDRRYVQIAIRCIANPVHEKTIREMIDEVLSKRPIEAGEIDILVHQGSAIVTNDNEYAVPLPTFTPEDLDHMRDVEGIIK